RIDAGTLRITADSALGSGGDLVLNGGTIALAGGAPAWTTARPVYVTATSGVELNGGSATWSGPVSGTSTGTLTVSSSTAGGRLTLSGNNTFNAAVSVGPGAILTAASPTALGLFAQPVTVGAGGTLEVQGGVQFGPK